MCYQYTAPSDSFVENSVASFFTPISQKPPEKVKITWQERGANDDTPPTLLVGKYEPSGHSSPSPVAGTKRRKVAAFDFVSHEHSIFNLHFLTILSRTLLSSRLRRERNSLPMPKTGSGGTLLFLEFLESFTMRMGTLHPYLACPDRPLVDHSAAFGSS